MQKNKKTLIGAGVAGVLAACGGILRGRRRAKKAREVNVYFISGMCYNCSVFDGLRLPKGYVKKYIEWDMPYEDQPLDEYARKMARSIDTSRPFVLVGYSFGAVIMQEMNRFLSPERSVIISSFKSQSEIPTLFEAVRRTHLAERLPKRIFSSTDFISEAFNRLVYDASTAELKQFMTVIDPVYIRWAVRQITDWIPGLKLRHLYHIHGTEDQIFPYGQIERVFPIEGGDHLMVVKKADVVSSVLDTILLMKQRD